MPPTRHRPTHLIPAPAWTCPGVDSQCIYNTVNQVWGCCASTNCILPTSCYEHTDVIPSSHNAYTVLCTASTAGYCAVVISLAVPNLTQFVCFSQPVTLSLNAAPTGPAAPAPTTPLPTTPSAASAPPTNGGLSTGAIVAIAICGTAVLLGALALAAWCVRGRRRAQTGLVAHTHAGYAPPPMQDQSGHFGFAGPTPPRQSFEGTVPAAGVPLKQDLVDQHLGAFRREDEWKSLRPDVGQVQTANSEAVLGGSDTVVGSPRVGPARDVDVVSNTGQTAPFSEHTWRPV